MIKILCSEVNKKKKFKVSKLNEEEASNSALNGLNELIFFMQESFAGLF